MLRSEKFRFFIMGFVAAVILVTVVAAATSDGSNPGRYQIDSVERPTAMIFVLDTHTGEVRYTGIGGAGGGQAVGALEMFAEPKK
jgi:hypothetical protein